MHNSKARRNHAPSQVLGVESFDERFSREIASINGDLARLEAALVTPPEITPQPPATARRPDHVPTPPAPAITEIWPAGFDLADPKNFGVHPPSDELEPGAATVDEYRQRLARHIAFATKVLHTSRVPAVVWREWRVFEKAAQDRLRALANPDAAAARAKD